MAQEAAVAFESRFQHDGFNGHFGIGVEKSRRLKRTCPLDIVDDRHVHGLFEMVGKVLLVASRFLADISRGQISLEVVFDDAHRVRNERGNAVALMQSAMINEQIDKIGTEKIQLCFAVALGHVAHRLAEHVAVVYDVLHDAQNVQERFVSDVVHNGGAETVDIEDGLVVAEIAAGNETDHVLPVPKIFVVVRGKAGDGAELTRGQGIGHVVDVRDRLAVQYIDQFHAVVKVPLHANARFHGNIKKVVSVPIVFVNIHNFPVSVPVFYIHNHYTTLETIRQVENEICHQTYGFCYCLSCGIAV